MKHEPIWKKQFAAFSASVEKLPQYPYISQEDVLVWFDAINEFELDMNEQLERLAGFAPHEAHVLLSEFKGQRAKTGSARELIRTKLMQNAPTRKGVKQRRLTLLKSPVIDFVVQKMDLVVSELSLKISEHRDDRFPYLIPVKDSVYKNQSGQLVNVIVDVPYSSEMTQASLVSVQYTASVIKMATGVEPLNLVCVYNHETGEVDINPVHFDIEQSRELFKAMNHYYFQYLIKGEIPDFLPFERKVDVVLSDSTRELVDEYLKVEAFYKTAYERREALKSRVFEQQDALADPRLASFNKFSIDVDAMNDFLQEHQDIADLSKRSQYDVNKLVEVCEKSGIAAPVQVEQVNYVSKGVGQDMIKSYMPIYHQHIQEVLS